MQLEVACLGTLSSDHYLLSLVRALVLSDASYEVARLLPLLSALGPFQALFLVRAMAPLRFFPLPVPPLLFSLGWLSSHGSIAQTGKRILLQSENT